MPEPLQHPAMSTEPTMDDPPKVIPHQKIEQFPLTLPSLNVAVLHLPCPMSERDFSTIMDSLYGWKAALVPPEPFAAPKEVGSPR